MTRIAGLLFTLILYCGLSATETDTIHSRYVDDDFVITIKKPAAYSAQKKYLHVYITDGSLGIGEFILGKNKNRSARIPPNCIIIAISHIGSWHDKRPRDFIPSDISKNEEPDFGKADRFYLFMQKELIPSIDKKLPNRKQRVFIGHSFGGLFCLYTLFKEDKLFDRHFAISPSAWANYYELDKIEEAYFANHKTLKASVKIYAGSLEFLNKVLASSRAFYKNLQERKYQGLVISKEEIGGANHYSVRKPAVDRIFGLLKE